MIALSNLNAIEDDCAAFDPESTLKAWFEYDLASAPGEDVAAQTHVVVEGQTGVTTGERLVVIGADEEHDIGCYAPHY